MPRVLLMHNANVVLLGAELLLNERLSVQLGFAPCVALYGLVHVAWHQTLRYDRTHTLMYPFLNWKKPWSVLILAVLHVTLASYYAIAWLICTYLRPLRAGPLLVAAGTLAILYVFPPKDMPTKQA